MSRWEPTNAESTYGSPSIAQIEANPGVINWALESRPGEFHPEPLAEPDVNLSAHPAPIRQTFRSCQYPNVRKGHCAPQQAVAEIGWCESYDRLKRLNFRIAQATSV